MKKLNYEKYVPLLIILILMGVGFANNSLPLKDPFGIYGKKVKNYTTNIKFVESAEKLGINHVHEIYDPPKGYDQLFPYYANNAGVAVGDIDNDGFQDVFFTTMKNGKRNYLYKNIDGKYFKDVTVEAGLGNDLNDPGAATAAAFFDYDNDGCQDLYVARIGCHSLYKGDCHGHFKDVSEETGISKICSFAVGVNVVDYNKDGYTDLYISNFNSGHDKVARNLYRLITDTSNNTAGGGENMLLENHGGKFFTDVAKEKGVADPGLTWASGWSDFNGDGYPDLYVANDFSRDQLYFNLGPPDFKFENVSKTIFRPEIRSRGSMTVEIGDLNNDLRPDVFVSNISRPGYDVGLNYMWMNTNKDDEAEFFNAAIKFDLSKCGWAWGARFLDADLDGQQELVVANGFWDDGPKPYWFTWNTWLSLPTIFRKDVHNQPKVRGTNMAANEPNCFFKKEGTSYIDIAENVGINDLKNGRGVAVADFRNVGKPDFVIANFLDKPTFYLNETQTNNNWVGFKLIGTKTNRDAIGAKVFVFTKNKLKQMKEEYPSNGLSGENDKRLLFGVGPAMKVKAKIIWPSGEDRDLGLLEVNQYYEIKE